MPLWGSVVFKGEVLVCIVFVPSLVLKFGVRLSMSGQWLRWKLIPRLLTEPGSFCRVALKPAVDVELVARSMTAGSLY